MLIDEDEMREEVEGFMKAELESSEFETSVIEMVWQTLFEDVELAAKDDAAATEVFKTIYKECLAKMVRALDKY